MTEDIVLSLILVPIFIGTPRLLPHDFLLVLIEYRQNNPLQYYILCLVTPH